MDDDLDGPPVIPMPDRRQTRPRMSLGGISTMLGVAVGLFTLFAMFWQGARWATNIDAKLEQALGQAIAISQMQKDLLVLRTQFDNAQANAARFAEWLQSLSQRIEGRTVKATPAPTGPGQ